MLSLDYASLFAEYKSPFVRRQESKAIFAVFEAIYMLFMQFILLYINNNTKNIVMVWRHSIFVNSNIQTCRFTAYSLNEFIPFVCRQAEPLQLHFHH